MFYSCNLFIAVFVAVIAFPLVCANDAKLNITNAVGSLAQLSPKQTRLNFLPCNLNSECKSSCQCIVTSVANTCANVGIFNSEASRCRSCSVDSDCPSDICVPVTSSGYCGTCAEESLQMSIDACKAEPVPGPSTEPTPCVETEWLKANGFDNGILREGKVSKTLCMKGLPCGTEGHLLRVCDSVGKCALMTYKQVCDKRGDCEVKFTRVSRLSATVDWSVVKIDECMKDGSTASLTSLSVHADGGDFGISWGIARLGEKLIDAGLGGAIDLFVLVWEDVANHCDDLVRTIAGAVRK